jgi:hypothetical protein
VEDILIGTTDRTILIFIPDAAQTDGSGKTGVAHGDLTVSATRVETDNDVAITDYTSSLNALSALTDAHNDWGWKEVSNTLAPGLYRLDVADALFASGAWYVVLYVMLTSSAASPSPKAFRLVANTMNTGTEAAAWANKIADHVKRRTQANTEGSSDGDTPDLSSLYGFIQQAQESAISGLTQTVKKTDGTTTLGTRTLTTDAAAEPITSIS